MTVDRSSPVWQRLRSAVGHVVPSIDPDLYTDGVYLAVHKHKNESGPREEPRLDNELFARAREERS